LILILIACVHGCSVDAPDHGAGQRRALDLPAVPLDHAAGAGVPTVGGLGSVTGVARVACPAGTPAGAICEHITITGCPGIESEAINATVAILAPSAPLRGTVVHLKGGGGEGFLTLGTSEYQAAGFRQVFVSWDTDWEQTLSHGIRTAGCRPATMLRWVFDDPALHGGSRTVAFCAEGKSGGAGQLGYALAHYGLGDVLDYVTERAGPPFSRIDLGCDGDAPPTATVCGDTVTMLLPSVLDHWENIAPPLHCGSTGVPISERSRWRQDSIAFGGVYDYPRTDVQFFICTHNAPAVAGMSQLYYNQIVGAEGGTSRVGFHCFSQADGCQGEDLGTGDPVAIQSMIDHCTPRH
jgi:hypothetical protein